MDNLSLLKIVHRQGGHIEGMSPEAGSDSGSLEIVSSKEAIPEDMT